VNLPAEMLDSQHSTVAFSRGAELLRKKADDEDWAVSTNNPPPPAMLLIKFGGADRDRTDDLLNATQGRRFFYVFGIT